MGKKKIITHNKIHDSKIRLDEEKYNETFLQSLNLDFDVDQYDGITINNHESDSTPYMMVWLSNVDRLFKMIVDKINLNEYHFCDVGCGLGLLTIYVESKYQFKSYEGFDYNTQLINKANRIVSLLDLKNKLIFEKADANVKQLEEKPYVLFMFNPFGTKTLQNFIQNNLMTLKRNQMVILYANDLWINDFKDYKTIHRDDYYNLSAIFF